MQIILPPKKITEGELGRAFERELRTGLELKKATEAEREKQAAMEAHDFKGHKTIPGLGKMVGVFPEWEFFRLIQQYGHAEVHSKDFMRFHNRKFPHLSPNKA